MINKDPIIKMLDTKTNIEILDSIIKNTKELKRLSLNKVKLREKEEENCKNGASFSRKSTYVKRISDNNRSYNYQREYLEVIIDYYYKNTI